VRTARRRSTCACGSGKKAKTCCGYADRPDADDLARAYLTSESRRATARLRGYQRADYDALYEVLVDLPASTPSMVIPLPPVLPGEIADLRAAMAAHDLHAAEAVVTTAVAAVGTHSVRADLAGAALALAEAGALAADVASLAVIDLAARDSLLLEWSLVQAVAVSLGGSADGLMLSA
jgi:hypothetical protein